MHASRRFDRDLMVNAGVRDVARATMALIDVNQKLPPHVQLLAQAANFLLLAEHYDIPVQDVFAIITNIMNHAEGRRPEFLAVADYMENELG